MVPLEVELPESRAIEDELPENIMVEVSGSGWNLFNLIYINSNKKCEIDLTKEKFQDSLYEINRLVIQRSLISLETVDPKDFSPDRIILKTGKVGKYTIPIVSNIEINPQKGFLVIGELELQPDSVQISGNDKLVKLIKSWSTQKKVYQGVNRDISDKIMLKDTLGGIVKLDRKTIEFDVEIKQYADKEFLDIPFKIVGGNLNKRNKLEPSLFQVTLRGGVDEIDQMEASDISIEIDYNDVLNDSTGIIIPKVIIPKNAELLRLDPSYIYHTIELKTNKINF